MATSPITRRAALRAIPAIAASAALPAVATATAPEHSISRVERLAEDLAVEMDQWMLDMMVPGARFPVFEAHVWPASTGRGIYFRNRTHVETPQERMERARRELVEATKAAYPEVTDWRLVVPEDDSGTTCGLFMVIGRRSTNVA